MNVLKHLFNFDRMITPVLIRTTFIFAVALEVLIGLIIMVTGGGTGVFTGLIFIVVAPLITRVIAELTILAFQINESLTDMKDLLKKNQATN